MTLEEALRLCRQIEEARNLAYTKYQIQHRGESVSRNLYMWENDWPHNCRATTTDGQAFLVGFNVNQTSSDEVRSVYSEVDCKEDWLKQYGHLYQERNS